MYGKSRKKGSDKVCDGSDRATKVGDRRRIAHGQKIEHPRAKSTLGKQFRGYGKG
jgi:hypothetical protein